MTSNLSVIRRLDKSTSCAVLDKPIVYLQCVLPEDDELRYLLVELTRHSADCDMDSVTFDGYVEAIIMHPDFTDGELDARMAMFKDRPGPTRFLSLQGAMIVYAWLNS